jgi:hypothetical protein
MLIPVNLTSMSLFLDPASSLAFVERDPAPSGFLADVNREYDFAIKGRSNSKFNIPCSIFNIQFLNAFKSSISTPS